MPSEAEKPNVGEEVIVLPPDDCDEDELADSSVCGNPRGLRSVELKPTSDGEPPKADADATLEENEEPVLTPPVWVTETCENPPVCGRLIGFRLVCIDPSP